MTLDRCSIDEDGSDLDDGVAAQAMLRESRVESCGERLYTLLLHLGGRAVALHPDPFTGFQERRWDLGNLSWLLERRDLEARPLLSILKRLSKHWPDFTRVCTDVPELFGHPAISLFGHGEAAIKGVALYIPNHLAKGGNWDRGLETRLNVLPLALDSNLLII